MVRIFAIFFWGILLGCLPSYAQIEPVILSREMRLSTSDSIPHDSALKIYQHAFNLIKNEGLLPHEDAAAALNNIGRVYLLNRQFDSSIHYFQKSINMYQQLTSQKAQQNEIITWHNIAIMHADNYEIDSAKKYHIFSMNRAFNQPNFPEDLRNNLYETSEEFLYEYGSSDEIQQLKNIRFLGKRAPEFNVLTNKGKIISLSSFPGKWILLDFWASWCGPCLREFPNLHYIDSVYDEIQIVGISVDESMDDWLYRMEQFQPTWIQGLDNTQSFGSVARMYHASRIPLTVLIDPDGFIRAYGLRGEALVETIESELNAKR